MPMNPEIKHEWAAALRSGKYAQGTGYLHEIASNEYCCLGVLCEIAKAKGVISSELRKVNGEGSTLAEYFGVGSATSHEFLPPAVIEWAGLSTRDPLITQEAWDDVDNETPITDLNDNAGLTFRELADLIEAQL